MWLTSSVQFRADIPDHLSDILEPERDFAPDAS